MATHDPTTAPERAAKLRMRVTVVYEEGEHAIIARILELPGAISQGESINEARANVLDAAALLLESYHEDNVPPELVPIVAIETHALDVP